MTLALELEVLRRSDSFLMFFCGSESQTREMIFKAKKHLCQMPFQDYHRLYMSS